MIRSFIIIGFFLTAYATKADETDQLVAYLSNTNIISSWNCGGYFELRLPKTAPTNDVIKKIVEMNRVDEQKGDYKILAVRQVHIPHGVGYIPNVTNSDLYTAAIVLIDGSKKIVVFKYWPGLGWWSRVYHSKSEALGCIDLGVKNAKLKSDFVWPNYDSPGFVLEYSNVDYGLPPPLLKGYKIPTLPPPPSMVIQIEVSDKQNGQIVISNSISAWEMQYDSVPFPSDMIRIDNQSKILKAGHRYVLFLKVMEKGFKSADVYLK